MGNGYNGDNAKAAYRYGHRQSQSRSDHFSVQRREQVRDIQVRVCLNRKCQGHRCEHYDRGAAGNQIRHQSSVPRLSCHAQYRQCATRLNEECDLCRCNGGESEDQKSDFVGDEAGGRSGRHVLREVSVGGEATNLARAELDDSEQAVEQFEAECYDQRSVERLPTFRVRNDEENVEEGDEHHAEANTFDAGACSDIVAIIVYPFPRQRSAGWEVISEIGSVGRCEEDNLVEGAMKSVGRELSRDWEDRTAVCHGRRVCSIPLLGLLRRMRNNISHAR